MRAARAALIVFIFACGAAMAWSARTPDSKTGKPAPDERPPELQAIDIAERPGANLPRELVFTDESGSKRTLATYLEGGKPLIVVLAYYRCPMLCSVVLNGLLEGLQKLEWSAGDRYNLAVVSFDPRDTVEVAAAKHDHWVEKYGRKGGAEGIHFLVGDAKDVKTLADAVGFHYRWDEKQQQYAHAAGAFVFNRNGQLSRTLYGINFPPESLRLALNEAGEGKIGTLWDKVILFCFHYEPQQRKYVVSAWRIMRASGAITALGLAFFLAFMWRKKPHPEVA